MNIQIVGIRNSADTRKAERFFKERRVSYHFVDLKERGLSRGELESVARAVGAESLIDQESKIFRDRGMSYMEFDPLAELLERPLLMKMPVIRNGRDATVGLDTETWSRWIKEA
jgi:arsenate reductase-like glutaredoxin family protein